MEVNALFKSSRRKSKLHHYSFFSEQFVFHFFSYPIFSYSIFPYSIFSYSIFSYSIFSYPKIHFNSSFFSIKTTTHSFYFFSFKLFYSSTKTIYFSNLSSSFTNPSNIRLVRNGKPLSDARYCIDYKMVDDERIFVIGALRGGSTGGGVATNTRSRTRGTPPPPPIMPRGTVRYSAPVTQRGGDVLEENKQSNRDDDIYLDISG